MTTELEGANEDFPGGESLDSASLVVEEKYPKHGNFHPGHQNSTGNSGGWGKSKFREEFVKQALVAARSGMTDVEIAQLFGVTPHGLLLWKYQHPELNEALKEGKALWDSRVEASFAQVAIGYSHPAEKIFMTKDGDIVRAPYTKVYPPSYAAAALWLANRKPREWGKKAGEDDRSLTVNVAINTVRANIENKLARLASRNDMVVISESSESSD